MKLKFLIAYDGGSFAGWQSQPGGNTVQDLIETSAAHICGSSVTLHGSGRTDAGVHALGQSAHIIVPDSRMTPSNWQHALNASLPPTIRILSCARAGTDFHARFSAKGKIYRYTVWNDPLLPPLEVNRAWHVPGEIRRAALGEAVKLFVGRHDFSGFCANRGKKESDTVRTIRDIKISGRGPRITLTFEGNGFLYKMVRMLTAAIVRSAQDRVSLEELRVLLNAPKCKKWTHVAPAGGLCLIRVIY